MTVTAIDRIDEPQLALLADVLLAHEFGFTGTIVEVAHGLNLSDDPQRLARLLTDAVDVGATMLRHGQSQALVESVALEIDRLIETASKESEKLPQALEQPLRAHLDKL